MRLALLMRLLSTAAVDVTYSYSSSSSCPSSGCYPVTADLLIGRDAAISATSTCGLRFMERYCFREAAAANGVSSRHDNSSTVNVNISTTVVQRKKCLYCSSSGLYLSDATKHHAIGTVIAYPGNDNKWWQSASGVTDVNITMRLEAEFRVQALQLQFKFAAPDRIRVLTQTAFSKAWSAIGEDTTKSSANNVTFTVAQQVTAVMINLAAIGGESPDGAAFTYFAISSIRLLGSCACHGHARECKARPTDVLPPTLLSSFVGSECGCLHHTKGSNCDSCHDSFQDTAWRVNAPCEACRCNNRSHDCHFDQLSFDATGSGSVCADCKDNFAGRQCAECRPAFFLSHDRSSCNACSCHAVGSVGIRCHQENGQCTCRPGYAGRTCDETTAEAVANRASAKSWTTTAVMKAGKEDVDVEIKFKNIRSLISYLSTL